MPADSFRAAKRKPLMATVLPSKPDALLDGAEPDYRYEVIDGRFVEKTMGVYENWLASQVQKKIYAYTSRNQLRVLGLQDEIDGGEVLPGFRLPVRELFDTTRGEH
jgi:Uma2 family endonuclease